MYQAPTQIRPPAGPIAPQPAAPEIPLPPEPQTLEQTGLTLGFLSDLALKTLYLRGQMTMAEIASSLGHTIESPVPSLFSLHIRSTWLQSLPGISVSDVEVSVANLRERGPLLITHNGVSGPAVLRLSAWGARTLHAMDYRFPLRVNWVPKVKDAALRAELKSRRTDWWLGYI